MHPYKKGDTIECIKPVIPTNVPFNFESSGGAGWRKGEQFKIGSVYPQGGGLYTYFPDDGNGVWSNACKRVDDFIIILKEV